MHSGIGKNQNSMIEWHDHSPSAVGDEQVKEKGGKVVPKTETEDARVSNEDYGVGGIRNYNSIEA
ncbi:hypothetical protein LINGRAHAP2_LOCUS18479 [Linum grandiflorum]